MNKNKNLIGQLRIYSLIDLVLLLVVVGATTKQLAGGILLWVGFLLFLEEGHSHEYREKFPEYSWLPLVLFGLVLYARPEGLAFVFLSWLYTQKNKGYLATVSPVVRGLQTIMLVGGIMGYASCFIWLAGGLTIIRNLLGDVRDAYKDFEENKRTWPVLLAYHPQAKNIHLFGCWLTSTIWWMYGDISVLWLVAIIAVQKKTYFWTPR
ncbi:MAG: hypothetical protein ABIF17_02500 [Patescibacteria group bacterium]